MSDDNCAVCLCELSSKQQIKLSCAHFFHLVCIQTLYAETFNHFCEETGRRLTPSCPMCRAEIKGSDLPDAPFRNPVQAARRREYLQRVISEPSYASTPVANRPLRLARVMISVQRAEREAALNELVEQRQIMLARQASLQQQQQPAQASSPEPSTSRGVGPFGSPLPEKGRKRIHESDTSSASSQASTPRLVISETPRRVISESQASSSASSQMPAPASPALLGSQRQQASGSQQSAPKLPTPSGSQQSAPSSQQPAPSSRQSPSGSQQPAPKLPTPLSSQQSAPKLPAPSAELQEINIRIAVAQSQLNQIETGPRADDPPDDGQLALEPEWVPSQGEEDLQPVAIISTWGRGRHMRYRIRWSDGSVSLNRTREVETRAKELLENYRRELRRLATARTRERQRSGEAPKIPGRPRGRGKGPGSGSGSRESS